MPSVFPRDGGGKECFSMEIADVPLERTISLVCEGPPEDGSPGRDSESGGMRNWKVIRITTPMNIRRTRT